MSKVYLVMPAYNEEANIETTVDFWHSTINNLFSSKNDVEWKLVVCDDGSKDNTYSILQQIKSKYPHLEALTKPNSGHGSTVPIN